MIQQPWSTNDGRATIHVGNCLEIMRSLPDCSVQCAVTSPPYFGLRDYGNPRSVWGGQVDHCHDFSDQNYCKCGAWHGCFGLEPSLKQYVANSVEIYSEVFRLLKDDGTLWLNIGDSFNAAGRSGQGTREGFKQGTNRASAIGADHVRASCDELKPKDLLGVPWRVALALQEAGWYLRCDVIWHKPNCMTESAKDRPTRAHEYIFLLSKAERYYYDAEAVKERSRQGSGEPRRNRRSVWEINSANFDGAHFATFPPELIEPCILAGSPVGGLILDPFNGSGTTGEASLLNGRNYLGLEISPEYCELSKPRLKAAASVRHLPIADEKNERQTTLIE